MRTALPTPATLLLADAQIPHEPATDPSRPAPVMAWLVTCTGQSQSRTLPPLCSDASILDARYQQAHMDWYGSQADRERELPQRQADK